MTAEVVEDGEGGSRRLPKSIPVVPASLGDVVPAANKSDNDRFVDDVRTF